MQMQRVLDAAAMKDVAQAAYRQFDAQTLAWLNARDGLLDRCPICDAVNAPGAERCWGCGADSPTQDSALTEDARDEQEGTP